MDKEMIEKVAKLSHEPEKTKKIGAETIINLISDESNYYLFHDGQDGYIKAPESLGYRIYKIKSDEFRKFINSIVWTRYRRTIKKDMVTTIIDTLDSKATHDRDKNTLHLRTAWENNALWYDLGNCRAVKITKVGWDIVENSPVFFRNYPHQGKQVDPIVCSDNKEIEKVFDFMNLQKDQNLQMLMATYLCGVLLPHIPRPVIIVHGLQGSAKSTMLRVIKKLLDPSPLDLLTYPSKSQEIIQTLSHHYLVYFDNVSEIKGWMSDDLCRACTGSAFSKRKLYTDDDDIIYYYLRAIGINGINLVAQKPDLLDRSLIFELEPIVGSNRQDEESFWSRFEKVRPKILGTIFTILSKAIALKISVILEQRPRLADYAMWGCAIAKAIGYSQEAFMMAYDANVKKQNNEALEASTVAQLIISFMDDRSKWQGSAKTLLDMLTNIAEEEGMKKDTSMPKNIRWLWRRIKEAKMNLNAIDIDVSYNDSTRPRTITLINKNVKTDDGDGNDGNKEVVNS